MTIEFTYRGSSPRLLLIFAGWGMDARPFSRLTHQGYDIAIAYDHRNGASQTDLAALSGYNEICIIGWSFGVIAASLFIESNPQLPLTAKIAVNGTLHPVDDAKGIPEAIFCGTLDNLSPSVIVKFNRRMCGSAESLSRFLSCGAPQRPVAELAEELRAIAALPHRPDLMRLWDAVYIGLRDMIIPTVNQENAWHGHPDIRMTDMPHLPDFDNIVTGAIINKELVTRRFSRSALSYDSEASVQRDVARRLADAVGCHISGRTVRNALEIGAGTGMFTNELLRYVAPAALTLWDITPISCRLPGYHRQCDAETEIAGVGDNSFDLVTGASTIQWFNSPSTFIRHSYRVLDRGGLLALSTFGPENFKELAPFIATPLNYLSIEQWENLLSEVGFTGIDVSGGYETRHFDSTADALRHIRQTGVNALGHTSAASTRAILRSGIRTLTYNPIFIVASKKSDS